MKIILKPIDTKGSQLGGTAVVNRNGSWNADALYAQVFLRSSLSPNPGYYSTTDIGFRLARNTK